MRKRNNKVMDGEPVVGADGRVHHRRLRVPAHGKGRLLVGNPGPRPNKWRAFCRWLAEHAEVQQRIERALRADPVKNQRLLMFVVEQGHGRARQQIEVMGEGGGPVSMKVLEQELARKIAGAAYQPAGGPQQ
jgi:hypothetical protein